MTPPGDPDVAAAFYRRQLLLAAVTGAVLAGVTGAVALAVRFAPHHGWLVAALGLGLAAFAVLLAVVVRHAFDVARFAFRNEVR